MNRLYNKFVFFISFAFFLSTFSYAKCAERLLNTFEQVIEDVKKSGNTLNMDDFFYTNNQGDNVETLNTLAVADLIMLGDKHTDYESQIKIFSLLFNLDLHNYEIYWEGRDENIRTPLNQIALESLYYAWMFKKTKNKEIARRLYARVTLEVKECFGDNKLENKLFDDSISALSWQRQQDPTHVSFLTHVMRSNTMLSETLHRQSYKNKPAIFLCGIAHLPTYPIMDWAIQNSDNDHRVIIRNNENLFKKAKNIISKNDIYKYKMPHENFYNFFKTTKPVYKALTKFDTYILAAPLSGIR